MERLGGKQVERLLGTPDLRSDLGMIFSVANLIVNPERSGFNLKIQNLEVSGFFGQPKFVGTFLFLKKAKTRYFPLQNRYFGALFP